MKAHVAVLLLFTFAGSAVQSASQSAEPRDLVQLSAKEKWQFLCYRWPGNEVVYISNGAVISVYRRAQEPFGIGHPALPAQSNDGRSIAYVRRSSEPVESGGRWNENQPEIISVFDAKGTNVTDFVTFAGHVYGLAWSPDGREVAFIGENQRGFGLYVVDRDDPRRIELINTGGNVWRYSMPSWSSDSQKILISRETGQSGSPKVDLVFYDRQTKSITKLGSGVDGQWSPKGDIIAYLDPNRRDCFTIHPDGSGRRQAFSSGWQNPDLVGPLVWSADGALLGFHYGFAEGRAFAFYTWNVATGKQRRLYARSPFVVVAWHDAASR